MAPMVSDAGGTRILGEAEHGRRVYRNMLPAAAHPRRRTARASRLLIVIENCMDGDVHGQPSIPPSDDDLPMRRFNTTTVEHL